MELALSIMGQAGLSGAITVPDAVFARGFNEPLVHQVVTACLADLRAGTRAQKSRAEVRGGGRKPWRQKGSGRARAGSRSSPLWRSGGVTFAAKPQDFGQKLNKKMYRGAMRSILSELVRQDRLVVTEKVAVEEPKTKALVSLLRNMGLENVLIVVDNLDANLFLAARNIRHVAVCRFVDLDPVSLLSFERVLMTVPAIEQIQALLGAEVPTS